MGEQDTLAYLPDVSDLREHLPDWPEGMNLVLCMEEDGRSMVVVFHEQESDRVLEKVAKVLHRPVGGFSVVPQVAGHPTRRILFSEEQQLLAMIAETEKLIEIASDYAINFNFAHEEGLDPDALTTGRGDGPAAKSKPPGLPERDLLGHEMRQGRGDSGPARPSVTAVSAAPALRPGRITLNGLPAGYRRLTGEERSELYLSDARITAVDGAVVLAMDIEALAEDALPRPLADIAFRDDFTAFFLPIGGIGAGWKPGDPLFLQIAASRFPETLVRQLAAGPHHAAVAVTAQGLHVTPGAPETADEDPGTAEPAPAPVPPGERSSLRTLLRSSALMLALGALVGGAITLWAPARLAGAECNGTYAQGCAGGAVERVASFARAIAGRN